MKKIISLILILCCNFSLYINASPKSATELYMQIKYRATPCIDQALISKFNDLQEKLGIKNKIQLFDVRAVMPAAYSVKALHRYFNALAFYDFQTQTITINMPYQFSYLSEIIQEFILYHELRHHLQNITAETMVCLNKYCTELNMTLAQAIEYDADTFALQQIEQCPYCLREIMDWTHDNWYATYTSKGYLTSQGVKPYLDAAKKTSVVCLRHKRKAEFYQALGDLMYKLLQIGSNKKVVYGALSVGAIMAATILICGKKNDSNAQDWKFEV